MRAGDDLSLITYGGSIPKALQAAEELAGEGVDVEVIDLRTLRPLDTPLLVQSLRKTRRGLVVDEGWRSGGISAEISARLTEVCFATMAAPIGRVCGAEVPIPYAQHLEEAAVPQVADIVLGASEVLAHG
jgi:pyruvate/2-oxoglutarate/acetoin dehydrogenase E1 component